MCTNGQPNNADGVFAPYSRSSTSQLFMGSITTVYPRLHEFSGPTGISERPFARRVLLSFFYFAHFEAEEEAQRHADYDEQAERQKVIHTSADGCLNDIGNYNELERQENVTS